MSTISSIDARFAQDQIGIASREVSSSVANLVSGQRTDANVADLSVGTILATRVDTLRVTIGNAGQAKSLLETAKGGLDTVLSLLQQQQNLSVKAADDSLTDNERGFLNQEFQAIVSEIDRISGTANFNGKTLLDGSISGEAGISTTTGLAEDNFSLISAEQFSTSVTGDNTNIATGDLVNATGNKGQAILNFNDSDDSIAAGTTVFTLDTPGNNTAQTISITTSETLTNAQFAAEFVSAANASTGDLARNFKFTDTGDGSVIVSTREASNSANDITIGITTLGNISANSVTFGGDNIDTTGTGDVASLTSATTKTLGTNGIISYVDANNIGETRSEATLTIGTALSTADTLEFTIIDTEGVIADAGDSVTVSFTTGAGANAQASDLVLALNSNTVSSGSNLVIGGTADATEREALLQSFVFELDGPADTATSISIKAAENGASQLGNVVFSAVNATDSTDGAVTINGENNLASFGTVAAADDIVLNETLAVTGAADEDGAVFTITDTLGVYGAVNETVTITFDTIATYASAANQADALANIINSGTALADTTIGGTASAEAQQEILRSLTLVADGGGNAEVFSSTSGLTFRFNDTSNDDVVATLGGAAIGFAGTAVQLEDGVTVTATAVGADRAVTDADLTYDANLIGQVTDIKANFSAGTTDGFESNTVTFTATVGDKTYVSEEIFLQGSGTAGTIGAAGNQIRANEKIVFFDTDGNRNSNDVLSDNGFSLNVGSSAISLADTSSIAKAQDSLDTIASSLQAQLDSVAVNQSRTQNFELVNASSGDFRIKSAVGTLLDGIQGFDAVGSGTNDYNQGDIRFTNDAFSSAGDLGSIGSFTVDRLTDTISTTIDGETYTAYLNSASVPSTGGVKAFGTNIDGSTNEGSYNSATKIIDLDGGTAGVDSAKLTFFSESETDGNILEIDLGNVKANTAQINISTDEGQTALADSLNAALGVSANDSLSFQVGVDSTDTIGVSIGSSKTSEIYRDNEGNIQTISIDTAENATKASEVLDNAIRNVVSLISDISASITSFNSAIQNNQASVQNADAARSALLDTDYSEESTKFAEARVKVDAANAVLSQVNSRIQNITQLLRQ